MTQNGARKREDNSSESTRKSRLHFTPPQKSESEVMALGEDAARLFGSPAFKMAWDSTRENIARSILATSPEEVKKREWLYAVATAQAEMYSYLQAAYSSAIQLDEARLREETAAQQAERTAYANNQQQYAG